MTTAVSAPGKVLLAGGFLVLDREYTGLVFGLSARIHAVVHDIGTSSGVDLSEIVVQSPQFRGAQWRYGYRLAEDGRGVQVTQLKDTSSASLSRNPFVETALTYALTYISSITASAHIKPASVTILADNDYYSQTPATTKSSSSQFADFGVRLQDAHKTGLGSSAALVTAFTGALLSHYLSESQFAIATTEGQARLHNLAQAAHCAAQGKVGSGFDVAAAVYGTCIYRRFSPSILSTVSEPGSAQFSQTLRRTIEDVGYEWDTEIRKEGVSIPDGMALIMCDVDCGSETVGLVKQVLAWRKNDAAGAEALWNHLQSKNETLGKQLVTASIADLSKTISSIRADIRKMGEGSGAPIEPPEQTALLDALTEIEGVIGGVVPGAGGYDAVALLVRDDRDTLLRVEAFLKEWSVSKSSNVKLLGVKGEMEGVRKEDGKSYGTWIQ